MQTASVADNDGVWRELEFTLPPRGIAGMITEVPAWDD